MAKGLWAPDHQIHQIPVSGHKTPQPHFRIYSKSIFALITTSNHLERFAVGFVTEVQEICSHSAEKASITNVRWGCLGYYQCSSLFQSCSLGFCAKHSSTKHLHGPHFVHRGTVMVKHVCGNEVINQIKCKLYRMWWMCLFLSCRLIRVEAMFLIETNVQRLL